MEQQGITTAVEAAAIEPARKIRAELNLEKWSIWQPSNSRNEVRERTFKKEISLENGDRIMAQVSIIPTVKGMLTTEDQKTYYALIKNWELDNRGDNHTYFSLRKLAKFLGKSWGTRTIETLTDSLWRIYYTQFNWTDSYYDASEGKRVETSEGFRILDKLKVIKTDKDGHITRAEGYFKFNDSILANFKHNHTKPVLLDVVLSFKSEVAQIIYTQLDRILSQDITLYEKRTKELFEDLGIEGKTYKYPSKRKELLDKAIPELENAPLSNGFTIASVKLEKTADGKDYKLVVKRGRARAKFATIEPRSSEGQENPHSKENRPLESRIDSKNEPTEAEPKGSELIAYFHQVFFGADKPTAKPAQKHRDLADWIIAQHGEAVARYVVEFAKTEAEKTNFPIATFGAVANYVDRAVVSYTQHQAEVKRREARQREEAKRQAEERAESDRFELSLRLYNELPEDNRNQFLARFRRELITSNEWKDKDFSVEINKSIFDSSVKAAVREHLLEIYGTENGATSGE